MEYKEEAYRAFGVLVGTMYEDFLRTVLRLQLAAPAAVAGGAAGLPAQPASPFGGMHFSGPAEVDGDSGQSTVRLAMAQRRAQQAAGQHARAQQAMQAGADASQGKAKTYVASEQDPYAGVGRNDPCPCGSGKKFKNCHGRNA